MGRWRRRGVKRGPCAHGRRLIKRRCTWLGRHWSCSYSPAVDTAPHIFRGRLQIAFVVRFLVSQTDSWVNQETLGANHEWKREAKHVCFCHGCVQVSFRCTGMLLFDVRNEELQRLLGLHECRILSGLCELCGIVHDTRHLRLCNDLRVVIIHALWRR